MFGTLKRRMPYRYPKYDLLCACCTRKTVISFIDPTTTVRYSDAIKLARKAGWARHESWGWRCPKHRSIRRSK